MPCCPCVDEVDHAPAAAPDHGRTEGTDSVRRAREIDVDLVVPVFVFHIEDWFECLDAGVREQDIDPAELLLDTAASRNAPKSR